MSRYGFECLRLGSAEGPEGARTPLILGPSALLGVLPRRARRRAATSADPHRTHHGEAAVPGARGSRFVRRRQQLQQSELRRASAPPHSLRPARAAATACPNRPSTTAARAPPRPVPPRRPTRRRTAAPRIPPRPAPRRRVRASPFLPRQGPRFAAGHARARRGTTFCRPAPYRTTFFLAEGHARGRVTRPPESRAVIGPEPWWK